MSGPAYDPELTLALPSAEIAVMGPEAAINAVYLNKLNAIEDPVQRQKAVTTLRDDYRKSYDIFKLASELVVDEVIAPRDLRNQLARYFELYADKEVSLPSRKHGTIL
jgi:acetyl-CoA carboxylase carboxyltransferase component